LWVIADLSNADARSIEDIDQAFTAARFVNYTIDCYRYHRNCPSTAG
jgi:hypothetical protein